MASFRIVRWCHYGDDDAGDKNITYLRSDVIRRATKRLGACISPNSLFAHAKICNLDVSILIQQDIVQFEVTINNAMSVQEKQTNCNFSCIKPKKETFYLLMPAILPPTYLAALAVILRIRIRFREFCWQVRKQNSSKNEIQGRRSFVAK